MIRTPVMPGNTPGGGRTGQMLPKHSTLVRRRRSGLDLWPRQGNCHGAGLTVVEIRSARKGSCRAVSSGADLKTSPHDDLRWQYRAATHDVVAASDRLSVRGGNLSRTPFASNPASASGRLRASPNRDKYPSTARSTIHTRCGIREAARSLPKNRNRPVSLVTKR